MHTSKQFGRRAGGHATAALAARSLPTYSVLVFLDGLSYQP